MAKGVPMTGKGGGFVSLPADLVLDLETYQNAEEMVLN